jgi:uncharacterized protein (DUF302 family)
VITKIGVREAMLYIVETSSKTIDEIAKVLEQAVQKRKFGVLAVHNLKETMAKKGVEFQPECRIYEVCNPREAKNVLERDLSISTALPCRISLYNEGGKIKLATIKPTVMIKQFGKPELNPVAEEIERLICEMMDEAIT